MEIGITDEMQVHIPQDYGTASEVQSLMGVNNMIVSSQASRPIMGVIQDTLLGVYLLTQPNVIIPRKQFMDCVLSAGDTYVKNMAVVIKKAKQHYPVETLFNGRVLFSILLPADFEYVRKNNAHKADPTVIINNGILVSGVIDKKIVGRSQGSIIHRLYKEYGADRSAAFLSDIQFMVNRWLTFRGFSVGMADFLISEENERGVEMAIQKAYIEVKTIQESDDPEQLKEFRINSTLNNRGQSLAITGLCPNNRLEVMIESGSKGSRMNIIQITGHLGQNNVEGRRIPFTIDNGERTLPCFLRGDQHPRCRGFIEHSFLKGLTPSEFWFHSEAGREGIINTAVKTRDSGYAERKLVKRMEDMTVQLDHTVRNSVENIVSFSYGDSLDPTLVYGNIDNPNAPSFVDIDAVVNCLNSQSTISTITMQDTVALMVEQRKLELQWAIRDQRDKIAVLKTRSDLSAKKMLQASRRVLKAMLAERDAI